MFALRLILAAGSLTTLISGAPVPSLPSHNRIGAILYASDIPSSNDKRSTLVASSYKVYGGTGEATDGWPTLSEWFDFDTMFTANADVLSTGCAQFGVAENSDDEIANIKSSISSVASSTGVDERFILAIVMQESNGCVRAPTTNYGVVNPGLMQSHDGAGSCNDGTVQNPCPVSEITQMITDGTAGTSSGDGLKQALAATGVTDVSMYYKAARIYNSGSIDSSANLGAGIATHCYSSDIANRLTGWYDGASGCSPATIATLTGVVTNVASSAVVSVAASSTAKPSSSTSGGVFVALPTTTASATSVAQSATPTSSSSVQTVAPVATVAPTPTSSPAVVPTTVSVIPLPASSSTSSSAAPSSTASSSSSTTTTVGAVTPGTACTTEGLWNCIGGSSFQQCASGSWSAIESLAAGMQCTVGQSSTFGASAIVVS